MICRVAFHEQSPEAVTGDQAETFRQWMKAMPGFVDGWHAADPATGRVLSFSVWESEAHMRALRDKVPPGGPVGMKPVQVEVFPVVTRF